MDIRGARTRANKTVAEVCAAVGVTDAAVYQWELGMTKPSIDKLPKLAQLFGCSVDELLREQDAQEADHGGKNP